MAAITIPTNYSWSHLTRHGSRGPSLVEFATAVTEDVAALKVRGDAQRVQGDALATQLTAVRTKVDSFVGNFNNHRGSAGVHKEADSVNGIAAPVATDVTVDILALVNDAYDMYVAHIAQIAAIHPGGADTTNVVTATYPATTEAEAIALINDIKAMYELHRANNGAAYHTNPDAVNTIIEADATDWDSCVTLANAYKNTTGFNAHIILTAGPTHGATGAVDTITAADCGVQIAALYVELIELKDDYSLHTVSMGLHPNPGTVEATADATTEATSVALTNALKATLNTNFADADVHMDADTLTVAGADCTEYEDMLVLVAEIRADYTAHIAKTTTHSKADAVNAETAVGAGGDVSALGAGAAVTIHTVMGSVDT
jgi:hypothetical protein